ncbi:shikimate dehydrogenase [Roseobacter denitrificans]|uniref:Shikimate dehydrogenase (NADP(+)) n=1 Tax=Roseobacter denitrificans (strain ATCC 33942 / OCh 114) TaxID=375451 RepID=AROE_ROSDO|nr:shikimate dehydrogenase [Roseobacter denitrificans]Q16CZ0.1 RecName: Full=Shikimate dehydrogenase (NADP(+)); Short=SDH [Roseobacter denitrificans OCh 114]ABG30153.1 shikimate 5-dehydrogenase, putative [Roseobacter denitrificans OCh 114]AVL53343.1 shikimate dehydrogenase [Roseobacter denitrificans]SFF70083.1 shikimate dehydrogenase [Roseobacter denitrificans OCh 114]
MSMTKIPLAGVMGAPIAHSKSPQLHRHWLETYGISGFYVPMEVKAADVEHVLRTLPKMGFVGLNVTLPHKEAVLKLADQITDRARLIGAANTLTFGKDGEIHADNTDGYGFLENLRSGATDWTPSQGPAVVLGAGGAARAVIVALLDAGVPEIILTNRTRARSDQLQSDFGNRVRVMDWTQISGVLHEAQLLVNTTSLGMVGKPEMEASLDGLQAHTTVTDLVYNPLKTRLLEVAEEKGCVTVDGLGMLLHQGVPGFERWFGRRPDVTDATRAAVLG